jgi:hypothetical protein
MNIPAGLETFASLQEAPVKVDYTTTIAASRKATDRWVPGLLLTVGYTWPKEAPSPVPIVEIATIDCSRDAALRIDGQKLIFSIDQSTFADVFAATDTAMYLVARAAISPSGREFEGEVSSLVGDKEGKPPYAWKGTAEARSTAAHENAIAIIRAVTAWRQENGLC